MVAVVVVLMTSATLPSGTFALNAQAQMQTHHNKLGSI